MSLAPLYTTDFVALRNTDTVADATMQMLRHRVTDLPVVNEHGRFLGLFKLDRVFASLLPKAALIGYGISDLGFVSNTLDDMRADMRDIEHHPVVEYLVRPEHTVTPETSPMEIVLLLYRGANNVPVLGDDGKLVGMVSARDLLAALHQDR
jgi:CBS-domain-containing membrane protein